MRFPHPPERPRVTAMADARFEVLIGAPEYVASGGERGILPAQSRLLQNYPNPFRPATVIRYELAREGAVDIRVFDVRGRLVRALRSGSQPAGRYEVAWRGRDEQGRDAPAGVYYYRLDGPGVTETRKMLKVH